MNRRNFLEYAAFATAMSTARLSADALNPGGIRVAGIRMIPVFAGKYKVWTKQMGSGPVKVLLLHGGPGFPHDYLEAMESFLPPAGIEMYY
jgi:proline iminopeptidase